MANKPTEIAPREQQGASRREPWRVPSPLMVLDRFADEMDRMFDDFGLGRQWFRPLGRGGSESRLTRGAPWAPQIEIHQRNNDLVVRADLPGMKKDDVHIEVTEDAITISGERRQEQETEREGVYRSERTYGSFYRTIPLPEGAITDQAKATFKDGVLEISMPAPPQSTRGRRLEITEGADTKK